MQIGRVLLEEMQNINFKEDKEGGREVQKQHSENTFFDYLCIL